MREPRGLAVVLPILAALLAAPAHAVDGVIEINQAKAMAGGVTPGDGPGFPVFLDRGGSYRLTSNLIVADDPAADANTHGIQLSPGSSPDEFDIDLNGFTLAGPVTCTFDGNLVCTPSSGSGRGVSGEGVLSLHDGTVRGFAGICVDMGSSDAYGHRLRNLDLRWCEAGVYVLSAQVENVHASFNKTTGVWALFSTLHDIVSFRNGSTGIRISIAALENCQSWFNGGYGIDDEGASIIRGCTVAQNTLNGLRCVGSAKCGYAESNFYSNDTTGGGMILNGIEVGKNVCGGDDVCP